MADQDEPEVGGGDEFEMRVEGLREATGNAGPASAAQSDPNPGLPQPDRFRTMRLTVAIVALTAVVVFGLAPGGGLSRISSSLQFALSGFSGAYPTPTLARATPAEIGSAPLSCAPPTTPLRGNSIGGSPVWVGGFEVSAKDQASKYVGHSLYTRYGWRGLTTISVEPGVTGKVFLRGERLSDGSPLWISVLKPGQTYYDSNITPSVSAALDPKQPGHPDYEDTGWAVWGGVLYIPAAGCYALEASWPGGSWRVTFAAGL